MTIAPARARIAPLEPPYDPNTADMLSRWMPPGGSIPPLRLFRTLARHPDLAARMRPLGAGILAHGLVPPRLREVMIHRTCALTGAEYEWGVHAVVFGSPLGLSEAQLLSTAGGTATDPVWDGAEAAVFALADELHATSTVSEELFATLGDHFTPPQILELVITAGWYHTIAYVIAAAAVEPEEWAARFPSAQRKPTSAT